MISEVMVPVATDAVKWTDIGLLLTSVALAFVTWRLFSATRDVAVRTGELAEKNTELVTKTADLVEATSSLAAQAASANMLADQHHQEALMPYLIATEVDAACEMHLGRPSYALHVTLLNAGVGPAIDLRLISGKFDGIVEMLKQQDQNSALPPGQSRKFNFFVAVEKYQNNRGNGAQVPGTFLMMYCSTFGGTGTLSVELLGPREFRMKAAPPQFIQRSLPSPPGADA